MPDSPITLVRGDLRVEIDPDYGGRVTGFWSETAAGRVDWLVPAPVAGRDPHAPQKVGMFPLVPFSNRIAMASFPFGGATFDLEPTEPGKPHAIHGHGCRASWSVASRRESAATLVFRHDGGDWPSPYSVAQRFDLRMDDLVVHLIVDNLGATAMPLGLGLHPFFPSRGGAVLEARFETVWHPAVDSLPDGPTPIPDRLSFQEGRPLPSGLDTGFGGWDGRARIRWPDVALALDIRCTGPFGHAILFTPEDRDFFCVEPVTHAINAVNLAAVGIADTGMRTLAAGERFGVSVSFRPRLGAREGEGV